MISMDLFLEGYSNYKRNRIAHWNKVADSLLAWKGWGRYYHRRLAKLLSYIIPKNQKVLELGCGDGKLISSLSPKLGVGIDFSKNMTDRAHQLHPDLHIIEADTHHIPLQEEFDFIILSDLLNDLWDVQQVFKQVKKVSGKNTRIVINVYSRMWEIPLEIGQKLGVAKPNLPQNWFSPQDGERLLELEDFEVIRISTEIIFPFYIPLLSPLLNHFLVRLWPFKHMALTNLIVARPYTMVKTDSVKPSVSIIIPTRNEAGNIEDLFERTPELGTGSELIFIEGHSLDDTYETIESSIKKYSFRDAKLFRQTGKGKGDAVRLGFEKSTGDILMILDADLSVPPEDLSLFYNALAENKGDFINGVRLIYPMEDQAMRFLNILGNKFFGLAFSWLLDQPIKDTLCGTKVLFKKDYQKIAENRSYFGDFDPFGDFDLLFGAAKLSLKIVDLPIRYRNRVYGSTNIHRFRHGLLLLKMVFIAAKKLKFI